MYKFVTDIDKKEFEKFVRNSAYSHFMQSYDFGTIKKLKNFIPHYVGIKENNTLVGSALILQKKLKFGYSYFYCPRGFVTDYSNKELVKTFTNYLKEFSKSNKAIYLKIDPAIKRHNLDIDGNILDENNNYDLIEFLKSLGFKHLGYNLGFEKEQPRFTFRIDLSGSTDDILKRTHPTTRKILNKNNQFNLKIYKGNLDDISDFYKTMTDTSNREGIIQSSMEYYKVFYDTFNKDGLSDLYLVKVNLKDLKKAIKEKIENIKSDIDKLSISPDKNKGKISDLNNQILKLKSLLDKCENIDQEEFVLSSIITVKYKDTVWTVHGGNSSILMDLNGNYECYWQIIKDAHDEGFKTVDCFGTCGIPNPDKSNPIYGIHSFKKRLGGEYIEFIGEFDLVINKLMYIFFLTAIKLRRKIYRIIKKK